MEDEGERCSSARMEMLGALRDSQGDLTHGLGIMWNEAIRTARIPEIATLMTMVLILKRFSE